MIDWLEIIKETAEVCLLVMLMMTLIEALNLESHGRALSALRKSKIGGVAFSTLMGIIPGCAGGFAVTSLYNHGLVSFGALVAMMIAATGDESFVMLSMFPRTAVIVMLAIGALAFVVGVIVDKVNLKPSKAACSEIDVVLDKKNEPCHHHKGFKNFLKENVLHHVILKHLTRVFAWTFGVMVLIAFLEKYVDMSAWVSDNVFLMIILAALVGVIPESGPHLLFVTLFAQGILPLPVLVASCISQDGHSGLALLAENKRSFLLAKAVNVGVAILVASAMLLFS